MKTFLFVFTILAIFLSSTSRSYSQLMREWHKIYAHTTADDKAVDLATDNFGNCVVTGSSVNTIGGHFDIATVKYSSGGTQEWVARYNSSGTRWEQASAIVTDQYGNIYVAGYSSASMSDPNFNFVTLKYGPGGNLLWANEYDSASSVEQSNDIEVGEDGSVYLAGTSNGLVKIIKYDSAGTMAWKLNFPINTSKITIKKGSGDFVLLCAATGNSVYLKRIESNGTIGWETLHTSPSINIDAFKIDQYDNMYVCGKGDADVIKFNSNGVLQWSDNYETYPRFYDLAIDPMGGVFVTGYSKPGVRNMVLLRKYNSSGSTLWTKNYENPYSPTGSGEGKGIATDIFGNAYTLSEFSSGAGSTVATTIMIASNGDSLGYNGFSGGDITRPYKIISGKTNGIYSGINVNNSTTFFPDYLTIKYSAVTMAISQTSNTLPEKFILNQNYPNPFNPSTTISFDLPRFSNKVSLTIYDALGRELKRVSSNDLQPGSYEFKFDAGQLSSGVYYYSLNVDGELAGTKKMVIVK